MAMAAFMDAIPIAAALATAKPALLQFIIPALTIILIVKKTRPAKIPTAASTTTTPAAAVLSPQTVTAIVRCRLLRFTCQLIRAW